MSVDSWWSDAHTPESRRFHRTLANNVQHFTSLTPIKPQLLSQTTGRSVCCNSYRFGCVPLVAQMVKNPPAMQETWAQALGWENPQEKRMATHSSILGENSMGRGAWWATVHGVVKSQTRLSD